MLLRYANREHPITPHFSRFFATSTVDHRLGPIPPAVLASNSPTHAGFFDEHISISTIYPFESQVGTRELKVVELASTVLVMKT